MVGVRLSRWTLAYFAAAFFFLIIAEALLATGLGFPRHGLRAAETLVPVHLVAIGWLTLLVSGALFQFVPVLVGSPLRQAWAALPALGLLTIGLLALVAGFFHLGGYLDSRLPLLLTGATLLGAGVLLVLFSLIATLAGTLPPKLPARFVLVGLVALLATASLGWIFAFVLSGHDSAAVFSPLVSQTVPVHALLGLGGWLTLTAIGVTHRLLPMFMLAPEKPGGLAQAGWWFALSSVLVVLAAAVNIYAEIVQTRYLISVGLVGFGVVAATYVPVVRGYFKQRRRKLLEMNSRMAGVAVVFLVVAVLMLGLGWGLGWPDRVVASAVFVAAFGWLTGLGLSQVYKIVPFLTWLECYGPSMGRTPTPRVQDLVDEKAALPWFGLYFASVASGAAALFSGQPIWAQVSCAGMLIGTLGILHKIYRARRLMEVDPHRQPDGVSPPHLFIVTPPEL